MIDFNGKRSHHTLATKPIGTELSQLMTYQLKITKLNTHIRKIVKKG